MRKQKLYKVLGKDGVCCNGGKGKWYLPKGKRPGKWMPKISGELKPCKNGYHLCRKKDLVYWLNAEIYEAEYKGKIIECDDKIVVEQARLIRKLNTWTEKTMQLFAADCAKRVLPLWEKYYPDDKRPHECIQVVYDYVNGKIDKERLDEAWDEAWSAADAAGDAADAAWSAASAAGSAAWHAAWHASDAADAARDAERKWQVRILCKYLEI